MADHSSTLSQHVMRRLEAATSFEGKLKCTFDPSMPLNLTDLTQPFTMSCETPSEGLSWWWLLIIVGGMAALAALFFLGALVYDAVDNCINERKKKRFEKAQAAQRAAEEAARNDYVLKVDS